MLFEIQIIFNKFKLNNDVQQIINYYIFSYYSSIICKYSLNFINYKKYLVNNIKNLNKINYLGYIFYDVFDESVAINFYRLSKIIHSKKDYNQTIHYFIYLRDFYIFKKQSWNQIKYDEKNIFYKMCKLSLKIFYKKYIIKNI